MSKINVYSIQELIKVLESPEILKGLSVDDRKKMLELFKRHISIHAKWADFNHAFEGLQVTKKHYDQHGMVGGTDEEYIIAKHCFHHAIILFGRAIDTGSQGRSTVRYMSKLDAQTRADHDFILEHRHAALAHAGLVSVRNEHDPWFVSDCHIAKIKFGNHITQQPETKIRLSYIYREIGMDVELFNKTYSVVQRLVTVFSELFNETAKNIDEHFRKMPHHVIKRCETLDPEKIERFDLTQTKTVSRMTSIIGDTLYECVPK